MLLFQSCRPGAFVFLDWPANENTARTPSFHAATGDRSPLATGCDPIKAAGSLAVPSFAPR